MAAFGPPFNDSDADITLRSSDRVDFLVYKVILSKASPVFKTMFTLPQPAMDDSCRPVAELAENSKVLAAFLSVIYPPIPAMSPQPLSLDDLIVAFDMARKYEIATMSDRLLTDFGGLTTLQNKPLEAFCGAYSRGLAKEAKIAAAASLKRRLTLDSIGDELQYTNGPAFHSLWKYHRACSAVAIKAISGDVFGWIPANPPPWWSVTSANCFCNRHGYRFGPRSSYWSAHTSWGEYLNRARNALRKHPCSEAITNQEMLRPSYQAQMCEECKKQIVGLSEFSRYLGEEVERAVSKVRLLSHTS
jgi:hypothetical protein